MASKGPQPKEQLRKDLEQEANEFGARGKAMVNHSSSVDKAWRATCSAMGLARDLHYLVGLNNQYDPDNKEAEIDWHEEERLHEEATTHLGRYISWVRSAMGKRESYFHAKASGLRKRAESSNPEIDQTQSIRELEGLSPQTYSVLEKRGLTAISSVTEKTPGEMRSCRGIGESRYEQIRQALDKIGLGFAPRQDEIR